MGKMDEIGEVINRNAIDVEKYLSPENISATATLLKTNFALYVKFFYRFISMDDFQIKKFHWRIIKKLEEHVYGNPKKKNLCICLPPRSGKSQLMILWASWCFAIEPRCNFIYTCYEEKITNKMSDDILNIMRSKPYQMLFGVELSRNSEAKSLWETKEKGVFRAAPLHAALTGFGVGGAGDSFRGAFIVDDPLNAKFFNSAAEKLKVENVYQTVVKKRLNNPAKTPIVLIMQRLATDDLVGYIRENEPDDWDFVVVKALDESKNPPESYWEERFPVETLLKERKQSRFVFEAQMQQKPIVIGGELVKEEWFKFYNPNEKYRYTRVFFTADTAFKNNEYADYTAVGLWGVTDKGKLHLIDLLHKKIDAVDLLKEVVAFKDKHSGGVGGLPARVFYIEDRASGMELIQRVRREGNFSVIPVKDEGFDKLTRWNNFVFPYLESGDILLPCGAENSISREVMGELVSLCGDMSHAHDDICDMVSYAGKIAFTKRGLF